MKKGNCFAIIFSIGILGNQTGWGQVANFALPGSVCMGQVVSLQNNSTGATHYTWDFCQDGLRHLPASSDVTTLTATNIPVGLEMAYDQGLWFGFVCSRDGGNKLTRLDFGNSLTNTPTAVDLSSTIGTFSGSSDVELIRDGGNWYGFVLDYNTNAMARLDFGSSLSNTPAPTNFGNLGGGSWNGLYDIALAKQGPNFFGLVTSTNTGIVSVLQFGSSITNKPTVSSISNSLFINPVKIEILKQGNLWYAVATSLNLATQSSSTVLLLNFGTDLAAVPTISIAATVPGAAGLQIAKDGNSVFGFVFGAGGNSSLLDFGSSVTNTPTVTSLGFLGSTNVVYGFSLVKDWPNWKGLFIEVFSEKVHLLSFKDQCTDVSQLLSSAANPIVQYNANGSKIIELAAFSAAGNVDTISHRLNVQNLTSSNVNIISQNECLNSPVLFSENLISGPAIVTSNWDFGDGHTDNRANTSNTYSSIGSYSVVLNVTSGNGCMNRTMKSIQIYNTPTANFLLPANNPLCTNQQFTFTNTSSSDPGSSPSWQWFVNGLPVSVSQNLQYAFATTSSQTVKLSASIPGCFNENTQTINALLPGPNVNFIATNGCEIDPMTFANLTTDPVTGFIWDFGDGQTSTNTNGSNSYVTHGNYSVKLTGSSSNGCQNRAVKAITIYTKPRPDFSLDLPPFSCSGSPSQFHDTTPNPTDSNLSSWVWSFGDGANGSSTQRNPLYTYVSAGHYPVGLTVTTNFGCSASIQKTITITPSPTASFDHTPACVNKGTQFTDTSTGSIKSWLWKIANSTYTFSNPLQVFGVPGTYSAQLTVTDNNNCIAQTNQTIIVPFVQFPDFSSQSICATKPAVFQDTTPLSTDPITSVSWDFGGQGSASGSPAQFTFPLTGIFSVKMNARAQSGCVYSVAKTITVVSPPIAGFTTSTDAGPVPLLIQFTNTSTNATSYVWRFHDKTNSTSTVPSPSFSFNELGEYIVDLDATSVQGCIGTFSKIISAVVPRVDAGLSGLQFIRDPSSGEYQALFVIDNTGNLPLINPTIRVEISGNATLKEKLNLTVLPGQSKSQILNYSLLPGGLDYICLSVDVAQDMSIYNNKQCVSLTDETIVFEPYPNPVIGELHLDWIATASGIAQLTIFNSTGAKAFDRSVEASTSGLNQIRLDVSNLSPGMYLIVFNYSGQKKTFRFAIQ